MLTKIISGGQTEADQAALDVAIKHDIPHGDGYPKAVTLKAAPSRQIPPSGDAHGRSSAIMTSRLLEDRRTLEYLLIPNGRSIAIEGETYPAATYGCTRIEITGLRDLSPSHYGITFPDTLNGWGWRIDPEKQSMFLEAADPLDQGSWLSPGTEYIIAMQYYRTLGENELDQGGWTLWLPEGGRPWARPIFLRGGMDGRPECHWISPFDK